MLSKYGFNTILVISLVIRFFFLAHPGFKADIAYWKWWGKVAAEEGATSAYKHTNYPPVYIYVLQATSWAYHLFSPLDGDYWAENNYFYLTLIKLPYIAADLGIGWLIYLILKKLDLRKNIPILASALFLLNPAVIYNSSIWGQTDSLSGFFILAMYYALFINQYLLFAILISINVFLKVQSLPFVILALVILVKKLRISRTAAIIIPAAVAAFVINLPHIAKNNYSAPISVMVNSLGYFPYVSLNAYNLHWLLIKGQSDMYPDKSLIGGIVSHKTLGTAIFGLLFLGLIYYLWKNTDENSESLSDQEKATLFGVSLLTIFASFLFMTEIHERYFFPIYMFGALLIAAKKVAMPIWLYIVLTLSGLVNLHLVMIQNYPENNLAVLKFMEAQRVPISLVLSVINILAFAYLFLKFIKFSPKKLRFLLPLGAFAIALLIASRLKFAPRISLAALKPTSSSQSWGELKINKSVGDSLLSPAYYFHRNGLGTHANSKIVYKLNGKYSKFSTGFGQDIESPEGAHTQFGIMLDEKVVFQSELFDKWTKPGYVEIPLGGAKELALFVLDGGDGINGDHADWLEPTLFK